MSSAITMPKISAKISSQENLVSQISFITPIKTTKKAAITGGRKVAKMVNRKKHIKKWRILSMLFSTNFLYILLISLHKMVNFLSLHHQY